MLDGASGSPQQACFGDSPRSVIAVDISMPARKVNSGPASAALVVGNMNRGASPVAPTNREMARRADLDSRCG